ncbi:3-hydroxybutyryl-CoA dehydrogenase, partial [Candidatus Parcubacteria bacterium]
MKTVAVIGAGTMGAGIAQVCAFHGYEVNLYDISKEVLGRSLRGIEKSLSKFVEKGKIDENKKKEAL